MSRIFRTLVAATAAGGLAIFGLMTAGAASASLSPGTYGSGSWSFDPGTGLNAIATQSNTQTVYKASVLQPINADGSSVFNHKSSTIPVQFQVQKDDQTTTSTVYPGDLLSQNGAAYPGIGSYGNLTFTPASTFDVKDITNLEADFNWKQGHDAGGSMRWQVNLAQPINGGTQFSVYYGDPESTYQTDVDGTDIGMNMADLSSTDGRADASFIGGPMYVPWSQMVSLYGNDQIASVSLVVDAGWKLTQEVSLTDVNVTIGGNSSEYVPGTVSSTSDTGWVSTNSAPAWIYLHKTSGVSTAPIDESTLTSTQGDTGGQFRQVDGKYIYNLPVNDLNGAGGDIYNVGVSFNSDGSSPVPTIAKFALK
jgi:hypothetical protein